MLLTLFNIFLNDLFEVELVYNILLVSGVPHSDSIILLITLHLKL